SHTSTSPNSISLISAMDFPLIKEVRACSAKRVPSHSGHCTKFTARSTYARRLFCKDSGSLASKEPFSRGTKPLRSEERRVGKECRPRCRPEQYTKEQHVAQK